MSVNEKIRLVRETKGLTQEQVAEKLGVSPTVYGDIERGDSDPKLSKLQKIAEILGISLSDLIDSSEKWVLNINFTNKQRDVYFSSLASELEKQNLQLEMKDKELAMNDREIENLKKQIVQLEEINILLKKNT